MQNAQVLNLGPNSQQRDGEPEAQRVEDKFHQDALIEQTRSDVRRMRLLVDQQHEEHQRRTKILSVILGILIVALAAAVWFSYPALRNQKLAVADMVGLKDVASGLGNRLNAVEGQLTASLPAITDQMDGLKEDMKTNMRTARTQAQSIANQVGQRVRDDVNRSLQAVQARLSGLESNQRESSVHVAQLEAQIARLNGEILSLRQESTASSEGLKQQLRESQQTSSREISGLNDRVATHQAALTSMNQRAERTRRDFEITNKKPTEIAPDIYLTIKSGDVGTQEMDAVLQFGAKGRNLPIRGQGIRKPVLFYMPEESRPLELVITEITKNKISGYLMMPTTLDTASKE